MNKKIFFAIAFALLIILAPTVQATSDVGVSILRQEPMPAQPGQYVKLFVQVENNGVDDATDVAIKIPNQFPFTLTNNDVVVVGTLKGYESKIYTFDVAVDSLAPTGINYFDIEFTSNTKNSIWLKVKEPIHIQSTDASLSITQVKRIPEEFMPGQKGSMELTIKNTAQLTARNIKVQTILADGQGRELPFIPQSATQQIISFLSSDELALATINLETNPSATPGFYKVPVLLTFYTDDGELHTQEDIVGVIIKAQPHLDIFVEESSLAKPKSPAKISLQFVNKGISDIHFLEIEVLESDDYKAYSQPRRYIGDLDSDDYRSEQYTIELSELETQLQVKVNYKDSNNNEFEEILFIPVSCCSFNAPKSNGPSGFTILLLLVIFGYVGYRIYKKKKHKKQK
jgi:hypothetical protein